MSTLTVTVKDQVATVTLDRPPANALDVATSEALLAEFRTLRERSEVHVILLASKLPRIFCAGADIATVEAHDVALMDHLGHTLKDLFLLMREMPQVIVAAVGGHCLGGGLELALAADFRLAQQGAGQVGLPEINLGLFPGGGGVQMAARLIGPQRAFRLALTGQTISLDEGYAWGLFDELIPAAEFLSRVESLVTFLAARPGIAMRDLKAAVWRGLEMTLPAAFDFERIMHRELVATEDCYEGVNAFREKRPARFRGMWPGEDSSR